jgi:methionyl aminopeptidase
MPSLDVNGMLAAGAVARRVLERLRRQVCAGMSTADLDALARVEIAALGATSTQLGYDGFFASLCTSRNAVVCHRVRRADVALASGDLVRGDATVAYRGWVGDCRETFLVGDPGPAARRLGAAARACRDAASAATRPGGRLGDVGAGSSACARARGVSVVRGDR